MFEKSTIFIYLFKIYISGFLQKFFMITVIIYCCYLMEPCLYQVFFKKRCMIRIRNKKLKINQICQDEPSVHSCCNNNIINNKKKIKMTIYHINSCEIDLIKRRYYVLTIFYLLFFFILISIS